MYEQFYGLKERPFSLLPDPDFLFLGDNHKAALDLLELAIVNQSGFCVISGEIGAGKTTLIRELLNRIGSDIRVGLVSNTHRSFGELMQWIMAAYGLECGSDDRLELHKQFIDFVIQNYAHKQTTLLIIDEAQNLSVSAMEELRMLSNVNSDKHLVLQVVLVGQQQLRDKLTRPELEQFAQRIGIDYHLSALNEAETGQYIRHRVGHVGGALELFSDAACRAVYRFSNGIPRLINRICDLSLVYGYAEECQQITPQLVQTVVEDQHMSRVLGSASKQTVAANLPNLKTAAQGSRPDVARASHAAAPAQSIGHPERPDSPEHGADHSHRSAKPRPTEVPAPAAPPVTSPEPDVREDVVHQGDADMHHAQATAGSSDVGRAAAQPSDASEAVPVASELHALVVDAEQNKRVRIKKTHRGFWLSMGIVIVAVGAAWSSQAVWYPYVADQVARLAAPYFDSTPVAAVAESQSQPEPLAVIAEEKPVANAGAAQSASGIPEPVPADATPERATARPETALPVAAEHGESVPVQESPTAEQLAQEAGLLREQQRVARIKEESARLERERIAEERRLAQEAELRREQQRLARVKEESARLERERIAAERKLAEQRKARQALEQKAKHEREKLREARKDISGTAVPQARPPHPMASVPKTANTPQRTQAAPPPEVSTGADTRVQGFFLVPAKPEAGADTGTVPKTSPTPVPAGSAVVADTAKQPPVARPAVERDAAASQQPSAGEPAMQSDKFLTNPCNGPTARFMSTCSRP